MPRHDQLFKDLFRAFFPDLIHLVAPEVAERLILGSRRFVDKELFSDQPEGDRAELDLLAEVPVRDGPSEWILVHVEIEGEHRHEMARRMWRYYRLLRLRHPERAVLPIVVLLSGGRGGVHWCRVRETLFDEVEIGTFQYLAFGLSSAPADEYVERPEALAWALAALMRWPGGDPVEHKIACLRPIAKAELRELDRFQLLNIVETYVQLDENDTERYAEALADAPQEVTIMEMTWAEQMMAKGEARGEARGRAEGEVRGLRLALRRFLERRFGTLPEACERRLAAIDEVETLEQMSARAADVDSLDELGLA
ncbi:MAG: hypothetical protein AAGE94_01405 [Acidobacteriota bacterium]